MGYWTTYLTMTANSVDCVPFSGGLVKAGEASNTDLSGSNHIYVVLVGLFSSITGGISYSLIRAGAKASDQPV